MARMVDASPFADDRVDPWRWRRLASIRPGLWYLALFPADHHSVDHHRNPSVNSRATPAVGCVARATPGFLRRGDDHRRCLYDWAAGQQFHRPVPTGDYRGEHLVLASGNVYYLAFLYFLAGVDRGTCPRGKAPAHFACAAVDRKRTLVVSQQQLRVSWRGLSGQFAGAVASAEELRTRAEKGRAARIAGLHRGHYPFHAWRSPYHRPRRADSADQPHRGGHSGALLRGVARPRPARDQQGILAARYVRAARKAVLAPRDRSAHASRAAALPGCVRFAPAHAGCCPQRVCFQFPGLDRTAAARTGGCHQGAHGGGWAPVGGHRARDSPAFDGHGRRGEGTWPTGAA